MIWVILALILALAGLLGAPFLNVLAPGDNVALAVFDPETNKYAIVATGSETLWHQWQTWIYIALFVLVLVIACNVIAGFIQSTVDQAIVDKKQNLDEKIAEYDRLQAEFKENTTREVKHLLVAEQQRVDQRYNDVRAESAHSRALKDHADRINKKTNIENKRQSRENRSKLAQRDRLSEQKRQIAEFLKQTGWTFQDGSPITYHALLELAREFEKSNRNQGGVE